MGLNYALILAGGSGTRMNLATPKQYLPLEGVPIVVHSLRAFQACDDVDAICLACAPAYLSLVQGYIREYGLSKVIYFASAGADRRLTSQNALLAVSSDCKPEDILLIHDAVRPFVTQRIIEENIQAARQYGAVYTAFPTQDTIVQSPDGRCLSGIPPRETLFLGQTPQSFRFSVIDHAHKAYEAAQDPPPVTDDCTLVLRLGQPVHLVLGSKSNIKITTPEDWEIAQLLAKKFSFAK